MKTITTIIIDRYPILRKWISHVLSNGIRGSKQLEAESVAGFLQINAESSPQLVILGTCHNSTVVHNLYLIKMIRRKAPFARLIVYDLECPGESAVGNYLKSGVNGYLTRQDPIDQLIACVKAVRQGRKYTSVSKSD